MKSFISSGIGWCREGGSNPHDRKGRRILSPLRLPVPPSRQRGGARRESIAQALDTRLLEASFQSTELSRATL
jgi:hypothetical protein